MASRVAGKIKLQSVDELLGVPEIAGTQEIEIGRIHAFPNHPFKVLDDEKMDTLVDSIRKNGILNPVIVRPDQSGNYEMISGHRRLHAARIVGLKKIPAIVKEMSDDEAIIKMVDANIQREEILPSEKAFAYKMKLDALKRTAGRPTKENACHNGTHLRSDQELALQVGDSARSIQRYVRLLLERYPFDKELLNGIFDLILETVLCRNNEIVVASNKYPAELVRSKFLKLTSSHIEYAMGCMKSNTTKVHNIKKYLLATLFNAPSTISGYYQAEVNHDYPQFAVSGK